MRILVVGATGTIGSRLVPRLVQRGHEVVGTYDPAPVAQWLPWLAHVLGAKPPRRVRPWMARLLAGKAAVVMGTEARGASNGRARGDLRWTPRYSSRRDGFVATYARSDSRPLSATGLRSAREGV